MTSSPSEAAAEGPSDRSLRGLLRTRTKTTPVNGSGAAPSPAPAAAADAPRQPEETPGCGSDYRVNLGQRDELLQSPPGDAGQGRLQTGAQRAASHERDHQVGSQPPAVAAIGTSAKSRRRSSIWLPRPGAAGDAGEIGVRQLIMGQLADEA